MVDVPRSSFIPKESVGSLPNRVKRRRTFRIFNILATLLLLVSLSLAGAAAAYKQSVQRDLEATKNKLTELQKEFENKEGDLAQVQDFDRRTSAAKLLLEQHMMPSKVFGELERGTLTKIQFSQFAYTYTPGGAPLVTITGASPEFRVLALQELEFDKSKLLGESVFTNVGTAQTQSETNGGAAGSNPTSQVTFTVSAGLTPETLRWDGVVPRSTAPAVPASTSTATTTASTDDDSITVVSD